jgi:predicted ATPase
MMFAHLTLGDTSYQMGQLLLAREHLQSAISLYEHGRHRAIAFRFTGLDSEVQCLSYLAYTLWALGYPDQALKRSSEAVALAGELAHPYSQAFAECFMAYLRLYRREPSAALEFSERLFTVSAEHGFTGFLPHRPIQRGWALAQWGRNEEGIAQISEGLDAISAAGVALARPHFHTRLAEAYMETGRFDNGLRALAEALAAGEENGDRQHEPERHRVKGELLLRQDRSYIAEAQNCFQQAIEIARQQSAKPLELRATMSLARLLASQGRRDEARTMLAEIYGWFTEGFDTADLKDAKALFEELNA